MKKHGIIIAFSLGFYLALIGPFSSYMCTKPVADKLGYVPSVKVLKSLSLDQKELTAAFLVLKVLMYFGGVIEKQKNEISVSADYPAMSRLIHNAVKLDPYNMDAYYFGQAILVWDAGKVEIANELLDYGMRYRTWDWYLPFFAGFNHAYFLKDYATSAKYYERAGELSGSDLFKNLAGRYLQESGRTDMALAYLTAMEKGEKNPAIKRTFRIRIEAFQELRRIEIARDQYRAKVGAFPESVETLVRDGYLSTLPVDPYGGRFYLQTGGKVATTSKFAFASKKQEVKEKNYQGER